MWKEYEISEENIDLYRELIPEYCMGLLEDGHLFGSVIADTERVSAPVIGVVLYGFTDGWIEIEWVAPTRDYDLADYGADMVRMILNKTRALGGFRGVFGRFRKDDLMAEYFPEDEFTWTEEPGGVYRFKLGDVARIKPQGKKTLSYIVTLDKAEDALKNDIFKTATEHYRYLPLSSGVKWDSYEQTLSAIYRSEAGAEGIVLISRTRGELVISLLYARRALPAVVLLKYAYRTALEIYGEDQWVACPILNNMSAMIVERIVTDPERDMLIRATAR